MKGKKRKTIVKKEEGFKVGDWVKVNNVDGRTMEGEIGEMDSKGGRKYIFVWQNQYSGGEGDIDPSTKNYKYSWQVGEENLQKLTLLRRGKTKIKQVNYKFILQYELDEDPFELFYTMDEVKKRIDNLVKNKESLKLDSIKIYEIKNVKTVKVTKVVSIKIN